MSDRNPTVGNGGANENQPAQKGGEESKHDGGNLVDVTLHGPKYGGEELFSSGFRIDGSVSDPWGKVESDGKTYKLHLGTVTVTLNAEGGVCLKGQPLPLVPMKFEVCSNDLAPNIEFAPEITLPFGLCSFGATVDGDGFSVNSRVLNINLEIASDPQDET